MPFLNKPVAYLTIEDFDAQGNLVNPNIPKNVPVVVMLQAGFCPHCHAAIPAYQQFADKHQGAVFCATVQADGKEPGEKEVGEILSKVKPGFRGFPDYVLYMGGRPTQKQIKGRNVQHLEQFVSS